MGLLKTLAAPFRPLLAPALDLLPGHTSGVIEVTGDDSVALAARRLSLEGRLPAQHLAGAMRTLLSLGGTSLLLHVERRRVPFEVSLEPGGDHRVSMEVGDGHVAARVEEPSPSGAWITGERAAERVAALHHEAQSEPRVVVFWVRGGSQDELRVRFPAFLRHATVIANGRTVAAALPLGGHLVPVVLRVP